MNTEVVTAQFGNGDQRTNLSKSTPAGHGSCLWTHIHAACWTCLCDVKQFWAKIAKNREDTKIWHPCPGFKIWKTPDMGFCSFFCWLHIGDLSSGHGLCFLFSILVISYDLTDLTSFICTLLLVCGGTRPGFANRLSLASKIYNEAYGVFQGNSVCPKI